MKKPASTALIALISLGLAAPLAAAPYKWVDEDGKVTYGDRPPMHPGVKLLSAPGKPAGASPAAQSGPAAAAPATATANLPTVLKTVAGRNPVVLYTGRDCAPCASARAHLSKRGIPFTEKSLGSEADVEAFRKLGFGDMTVPALSVGADKLTGYESGAWDRALDGGGYPKSSLLPHDYKAAAAEPLAGASANGSQGGRVVERITKERPSAMPAAAVLDAPALQGSPTSIRF